MSKSTSDTDMVGRSDTDFNEACVLCQNEGAHNAARTPHVMEATVKYKRITLQQFKDRYAGPLAVLAASRSLKGLCFFEAKLADGWHGCVKEADGATIVRAACTLAGDVSSFSGTTL